MDRCYDLYFSLSFCKSLELLESANQQTIKQPSNIIQNNNLLLIIFKIRRSDGSFPPFDTCPDLMPPMPLIRFLGYLLISVSNGDSESARIEKADEKKFFYDTFTLNDPADILRRCGS